jgi:murein DD-endopeptidase MepM/ murein hydrolase activator NlpD
MYRQTTQGHNEKKGRSTASQTRRKTGRGQTHDKLEQVRQAQLLVCVVLFLAVWIGNGVFPTQLSQVRDRMSTLISSNTDFRAAFSSLGESFFRGGNILGTLETFCVEVFGADTWSGEESEPVSAPQLTSLFHNESQFLSADPDSQEMAEHYFSSNRNAALLVLRQEQQAIELEYDTDAEIAPEPVSETAAADDFVAAVGTLIEKSDYSGQPLPDRYTMDHLSLGDLETITPVLGRLNSVYGYRDHPINGNYQFHGGVDIGGQTGDTIQAFAAGTVDYVGEDASYGLYLQLDHGNGIKSFYAHCSKICVSAGQSVTLGEKIAEVGSSGSATGPHLHLELKYDGTHLDPSYYIEVRSDS